MVAARHGLWASLAALVLMITVLGTVPGIGLVGAGVALGCGIVLSIAAARSAARQRVEVLGPADLVTLTRATLSCGVAGLVAESPAQDETVTTLVALAAVALALDAVDGQVARRTGTASSFGARLDGEADAFLMLVLSVHVARTGEAWVLAIGGVRYLFAMAAWVLPWMRAELPRRHWRKVVTATAGIALTFAAADVAAHEVERAVLALPVILLAESFGRDVWWLWRHRGGGAEPAAETGPLRLRVP